MKHRSMNALAVFAILLWGCTTISALVRAQNTGTPTQRAETLSAPQTSPGSLTDETLKTMLSDMGYAVKPLSKGYQITIKRDRWTFNIQVVLSDNREKLGMNTIAGDVKKPADVPAASWLALLETNPDIDPTTFYFDKTQNRLCLHRACDNRGITREILKKELDSFCFDVTSTAALWRFTE